MTSPAPAFSKRMRNLDTSRNYRRTFEMTCRARRLANMDSSAYRQMSGINSPLAKSSRE